MPFLLRIVATTAMVSLVLPTVNVGMQGPAAIGASLWKASEAFQKGPLLLDRMAADYAALYETVASRTPRYVGNLPVSGRPTV